MLYERFVILLKSRFYHIYISSIPYFFHQKYYSPTLGGNTKNIPNP
jgi:hypothetical protein